ncbi:MAG: formyl transferase [candidate division Zixibacteria bacterium]|nr:formyl transferase [candidate division Zixibacteria bacterium]
MIILLLGPAHKELRAFLESFGDEVRHTDKRVKATSGILERVSLVISYGYRYILKDDFLSKFHRRIINLHISFLPWNRGADPNLWSFLEGTPKGVTIHLIDAGVDTGDIISQRKVNYRNNDTLRTTYDRLNREIKSLLVSCWPGIRSNKITAKPQPPGGTFHRTKDKENYQYLLTQGWDTPVNNLIGKLTTKVKG